MSLRRIDNRMTLFRRHIHAWRETFLFQEGWILFVVFLAVICARDLTTVPPFSFFFLCGLK